MLDKWWLALAQVIHYRKSDLLSLTIDEFMQAIEYVRGQNAG